MLTDLDDNLKDFHEILMLVLVLITNLAQSSFLPSSQSIVCVGTNK